MFNNSNDNSATIQRQQSVLVMNQTLRNTYILLSLTLLFSAIMAFVAMSSNAVPFNPILQIVIVFALLFGVMFTRNSPIGIVLTFVFTGFTGWTLGPLLNFYINSFSNGPQLIMMALGGTGVTFLVMSGIAMNPTRDFSRLGTFLFVGVIAVVILSLLNMFWLKLPGLQLGIAIVTSLIFSAFILYDTNRIVRGGETNYVMATVSLYLDILNLFLSLLQILAAFSGRRD